MDDHNHREQNRNNLENDEFSEASSIESDLESADSDESSNLSHATQGSDSDESMVTSSNESSLFSDGNVESSDSDESMETESSESNVDEESENDQNENYQPFFQFNGHNQLIRPRANWRPREYLFTILSKSVQSRETYESILGNFEIINAAHEEPILPQNKPQLWKLLGRNDKNINYRVFCTVCKKQLGKGKKPRRFCPCGRCGPNKRKQPLGFFIHVSVKAQLKELLSRPNMAASLDYRYTRARRDANSVDDLYDGAEYRKLEQGFLANRDNYSFTIWIDGVKIAKSSSATAVPILLVVNELSPHARKRHIILAGLCSADNKPLINDFLKPVVQELASLYREGITWTPYEGGRERTSRFVTCILACDSDARWDILNMTRFNGYYGCTFCYILGEREGKHHFYPTNILYQERTHEEILDDMIWASEAGVKEHGVKGLSALAALPGYQLSTGVIVDGFHAAYEGAGKKILELFMTDVQEPWYIGNPVTIKIIDDRLRQIRTPSRISRHTRSIEERGKWKGTEFRNLLYYGPVVFHGILPPSEHNLFAKLSEALFLLNQSSIPIPDLDRADTLLDQVMMGFRRFGDENLVYNIHLFRHLITSARNWGPMWAYSGAIFEAWNRILVESVKSPNDRGSQIVNRFLLRKFLEDALIYEDILPEARALMSEHLNIPNQHDPNVIYTGQHFSGQNLIAIFAPRPQEIELFQLSGIQIDQNSQITKYESAIIHGTRYKMRDEAPTDYCDYYVNTTDGFFICEEIVSLRDINNQLISGIYGSRLRTGQPLFGTSYIKPYIHEDIICFIPYTHIISPAISVDFREGKVIIPLPNCWESD